MTDVVFSEECMGSCCDLCQRQNSFFLDFSLAQRILDVRFPDHSNYHADAFKRVKADILSISASNFLEQKQRRASLIALISML